MSECSVVIFTAPTAVVVLVDTLQNLFDDTMRLGIEVHGDGQMLNSVGTIVEPLVTSSKQEMHIGVFWSNVFQDQTLFN